MLWLILSRALQGIGGGGIMPLIQTTLSDMVAPRDRGKYQVYFSTGWIVAGLSGPVLGGVISEHIHWSFIFWINLPIGAVSLAMLIPNMKKIPVHLRPRRVDFVGGFLLMVAAVTIMLVLTWGGNNFAWISPTIIAMLGASLLLTLTFIWHARRTPEPFLPISLLTGSVVPYAMTAAACSIGTMVGVTVHMPLYYQVTYGLDASVAGSCLMPLAAGSVPGAALAGQMMARSQHYKLVPMLGLGVACLIMAALAVSTPLSLPVLLVLQTIVALGCGTCLPVTTISSQNAVARHQVGTVTGAQNFARALAASFVVAIFTAILFARLGGHASLESTDLVHAVPKAGLIEAYRWIFGSAAVLLGIGTVMMMLMEERPLPGRGLGKGAIVD
jgi:MFS family permease